MDARALEGRILSLLDERGAGKTICPSEVARAAFGAGWRGHMDEVRAAGRALESRGQIEWRQRGERVDPAGARGPVRFAKR